jgi:hypothetical protein
MRVPKPDMMAKSFFLLLGIILAAPQFIAGTLCVLFSYES